MKHAEFELAQATSAKLRNASNPVSLLVNEDRKKAVRYLQILETIEKLETERQAMEIDMLSLFQAHGVEFAQEGKSTYYAVSFRESYAREYIVFRKGEAQQSVDYTAYAKSMGETADTLKAKGFFKMKKGTSKIEKPNKSQLKMLMELFTD